jgi:opacity protein-like surface antigen
MNKLTKALCLSSALLLSPMVQAQWLPNWLVGVSGGWAWLDGNLDYVQNSPGFPVTTFTVDDTDSRGGLGSVLVGYQATCNHWLLGLEVNIDWMDTDDDLDNRVLFFDTSNTVAELATDYKRDINYALTMRLGRQVSPFFMPYIRAGVETSRDTINFQVAFTDGTFAATDGSRRSYRFVGGVGAELPIPVWSGLTFRAEWDYHSKGRAIEADARANDDATLILVSTKRHANSAIASLIWNLPV